LPWFVKYETGFLNNLKVIILWKYIHIFVGRKNKKVCKSLMKVKWVSDNKEELKDEVSKLNKQVEFLTVKKT